MGHDVFISHSAKDKDAAEAVLAALEAGGVRCWMAPRNILPGATWAGSILKAISDSRLMVLVFSSHTNDSPHVQREVERAVHHKIPVALIRIEDVTPRDDLEYFLSASHWMNATVPPLNQHLPRLVDGVRELLGARGEDDDGRERAASGASAGGDRPPSAAATITSDSGANLLRGARSRLWVAAALVVLAVGSAAGWGLLSGWFHGRNSATPDPSVRANATSTAPARTPDSRPAHQGQARMRKRFDLMNSLGMRFVRVAPGEFLMGSPAAEAGRGEDERQRPVRLTRPVLLGTEEVTRGQFAAFIAESGYRTEAERDGYAFVWNGTDFAKVYGPTWRRAGYDQDDTHPVVNVSWNDAAAFCAWLGAKENNGYRHRLPTEAEWEYACRAGSVTAYAWGDEPAAGAGKCNAADVTGGQAFPGWASFDWADGYVHTAPAGSFEPNPWGLYDLHGNVLEWCADWHGEYPPDAATDPAGPASGTGRVVRGGSWGDPPRYCRAATRRRQPPNYRSFEIGFRVALEQVTSEPGAEVPQTMPAKAGG